MGQTAKYRQVEEFIKSGIADGSLKVGSKIMTEEQLGRRFGFSRMTVNKALLNLSKEGYIERIPGKGSFVRTAQVVKPSDSSRSFTEDMEAIGKKAGSQLLSYEVIRGEDAPSVAEKLGLADDDLIHYFARLRTGDVNLLPSAITMSLRRSSRLSMCAVLTIRSTRSSIRSGCSASIRGVSSARYCLQTSSENYCGLAISRCFAYRTVHIRASTACSYRSNTPRQITTAISILIFRAIR